jgi:hypothetical protein
MGGGTAPSANPGNEAAAMQDVSHAMKMLTRAMQSIPMGSPLHSDVLEALKKFGKHMSAAGQQDQGLEAQRMHQLMRQAQAQGPQQAALRAMMQQQGGGGGAPPVMPPQPQQQTM